MASSTFHHLSLLGLSVGELWSPRTDGGVVAQVAVTIAVIASVAWLVRREKALVQLVLGVGMVVLAWYGIRGLH